MKHREPKPDASTFHPSGHRLRLFVEGKLSEQHIVEVEKHLEHCRECCQSLHAINGDDALTKAIRSAVFNNGEIDTTAEPKGSERTHANDLSNKGGALADMADTTRDLSAPSNVENQNIGRFTLIRVLGQGGFGVVWLAKDPDLGRTVALKIPRTGALISRDLKNRFLREAKAAAALQHPNVVQVFEAGESDGVCFIASEYCLGSDLKRWLEDSPPPSPRLAAWIVHQIAIAVSHAHDRGILHRDLKPGNVMLEPVATDNEKVQFHSEFGFIPKVADFGLAKIENAGEDETATRAVLGSVAYMAPEQAQGSVVNAKADIYSLGVILFLMLAGRLPHVGKNDLETLRLARQEAAVPPSRYRRIVPRDLDTICLKCLEIEPDRRFASTADLCKDLNSFLGGEPILARSSSTMERLILWARRKPWVATVWLLLGLTTIGASAFSWALITQRDEAIQRLAEKQIAERDAKLALFDASIRAVRLGRLGTHTGRRFEGLAAAETAAGLLNELDLGETQRLMLRKETIGCLSLFDMKPDVVWNSRQSQNDTTGIAVDSSVQCYATWTADGNIEIRQFSNNQIVNRIENDDIQVNGRDDWHLDLKFSPDGRYLATNGERNRCNFRVWDLSDANRVVLDLNRDSPATGSSFDFSDDSTRIATYQHEIVLYELPAGKEVSRFGQLAWSHELRFSPFGNEIASAGRGVSLFNTQTGTVVLKEKLSSGDPYRIAWHPNSDQLAFSLENKLFFVPTRQPISIAKTDSSAGQIPSPLDSLTNTDPLIGHTNQIISIGYNSSGRLAATSSWDGMTCIWDTEQKRLVMKTDRTAISFSKDDRFLAFGVTGNEIGRWQIANGTERRALRHEGPAESLTFALQGRLLIAAGDKSISTWDTKTGRLLDRRHPGKVFSVWAHPDDTELWLAGPNGLFRSHVNVTKTEPVRITIAPGQHISAVGRTSYQLAGTPDGRFIAVSRAGDETELLVLDAKSGKPVSKALSFYKSHRHTISPDGRYVAGTNWLGYQCTLYDVTTQKQIKKFRCNSGSCQFSPDGLWLVIGDENEYRVISTADWNIVKTIKREPAKWDAPLNFNRSGSVVAICSGFQTIKLLETKEWTELATLCANRDGRIREIALTNNGDLLAASHWDESVTLWDLRQIRAGLRTLSIDWEAKEYLPLTEFQSANEIRIK